MKAENSYRYIFVFSFILFLLICASMGHIRWDDVYELKLGDNDNYMRYLQFTAWMQNGNWYLEPMPRFNPQDGVVMHWPRITDMPLVIISKIALLFTDLRSATTLAMILVPPLYLLGTAICIGYFTHHYFNAYTARIAILFTFASPFISKFFSGYIDHHNLQIFLLSACIAFSALIQHRLRYAILQGLCIALSIWVGLENMFFFALLLGLISIQAIINKQHQVFSYHAISCLSASAWGLLFLLINRPLAEFFTPYYDAISIPFIYGFIASSIFCYLASQIIQRSADRIWIRLIISAALCFSPIIYVYPELIHGAFYNYPKLLVDFWLSHVSEAMPITKLVLHYDAKNSLYIVSILPALLLPLCTQMRRRDWFYYIFLLIALLLPLFWQVKAMFDTYVIAIPLQAYACYSIRKKIQLPVLRTIVTLYTAPLIIWMSLILVLPFKESSKQPSNVMSAIELLDKHKIHNKLIQAPIDYGTKILTFTDNRIIAAPYHRNIKGNTANIEIFNSQDDNTACQLLHKKHIDYVLISDDTPASVYLKGENTFMRRLLKETTKAPCIELLDKNEDIHLYRVQ